MKNTIKRGWYHFSVDDFICGFREICLKKPSSIFDIQPFKFIKFLHDKFNAKITLFLFYKAGDFSLPQMPEKYKNEFKKNAGWLKLAPHALSNEYSFIMKKEKIIADFKKIKREIIRFASDKNLPDTWRGHFYYGPLKACQEIKKMGTRRFFTAEDSIRVSYYLGTNSKKELNKGKGYVFDKKNSLLFIKTNIRVEDFPGRNKMEEIMKRQGFLVLMTHEKFLLRKKIMDEITSLISFLYNKNYKSLA